MSDNHKLCVCGWKPPKNVKIAVPEPWLELKTCEPVSGFQQAVPVKKGVSPCGWGKVVKKLSQRTC
jgi:hypothetical protein